MLDVERWTFDVRIFLFLLLTGCSPDPFPRPTLPPLINPDPTSAQSFPARLPNQFTSDDTVLLQAPFNNNFAILGVLTLNQNSKTFELAGLNQLGVVFFQIGSDKKGPHITQAIPPLMAHKDILLSMATDIQRIYFDLAPPQNAQPNITETQIQFTSKTPIGQLNYAYAYNPPLLIEKQLANCFGATWRVRYYDYRPGADNKLFPHGIVMDNNHFHYRIIIKNRDWAPPDDATTQP